VPRIEGLTQAVTVKVNDRAISQQLFDRLAEARVELSYGAAGWFQLKFASDEPLSNSFAIGQPMAIAFDDDTGSSMAVFTGTIDSLSVDYDRGLRQLIVSGYDNRRKLGSEPVIKAYTNSSYGSIISNIASSCGLQAVVDGGANEPNFKHVMQASSNIEFISQLARRLGMDWSVDNTKLVVGPRATGSTIELEFGEQLRRFSARYTATEHPETVEVHGWDPATKSSLVASDRSSQGSPSSSVGMERSSRSAAANGRTALSWAHPLASEAEGEMIAKGFARRMASADLTGRGETTGNPGVVPGVSCKISGIDGDWNGTYFVTSSEHVYRRGDPYLTRFTVGAYESSSMVDLMGPPSHGSGVKFGQGVTIGVVTNNKNTDNNYGEVKVKFPYLDDDVESTWARIATIGAGKDRGVMFMPEVNDEVLVAFEHGDITRPYVIGSLWNGEDTPPLQRADADLPKRTIVSKLGHKLTFLDGDADDKKNVTIELADGATKVHVGHDKIEIIANDGKPIEVKNDKAKVVLMGNGDLKLEGENITVTAKKTLKLEGQKIETSSQTDTKITAGAKLEASSSAPAKISSSAILELKGAMVKVN
jgi:phage protein D/phage baseplate assembly protein gpV